MPVIAPAETQANRILAATSPCCLIPSAKQSTLSLPPRRKHLSGSPGTHWRGLKATTELGVSIPLRSSSFSELRVSRGFPGLRHGGFLLAAVSCLKLHGKALGPYKPLRCLGLNRWSSADRRHLPLSQLLCHQAMGGRYLLE